jgi:hypothetical protein
MIKNKKAWLRIVEAFFAIIMIIFVLLIIVTRQPIERDSYEIHNIERGILRQVALNDSLRRDVLNENEEKIARFIRNVAPVYWNFTIEICNIEELCAMEPYPIDAFDKDIYADEILISSTIENYNPKKLKLFVWEKNN